MRCAENIRKMSKVAVLQWLTSCLFAIICLQSCGQKTEGDPRDKSTISIPAVLDSAFQKHHFDPRHTYSEPICLQYRGRPLLTMGQNVQSLDTSIFLNLDANGEFPNDWPTIVENYAILDDYILKQSTGSLNGIILLATDSIGHIFKFSANWYLAIEDSEAAENEAIQTICGSLFPCTCNHLDFEEHRQLIIHHADFDEQWELEAPENEFDRWGLHYTVQLGPQTTP